VKGFVVAAEADNLSASLEDYLEAIFNLVGSSKVARSKDIAKSLGVSRAAVTGALRLLRTKGLANYKPYDFVTLTEDGRVAAAKIVRKHNILKSFFVNVLGIDPATAQKAACSAEHELGPEVIARLLAFIEFVTDAGKGSYDIAEEFRKFWQNRSHHAERLHTREGSEATTS
jgi:DtxR family Mn-dependent transcriptional regulator